MVVRGGPVWSKIVWLESWGASSVLVSAIFNNRAVVFGGWGGQGDDDGFYGWVCCVEDGRSEVDPLPTYIWLIGPRKDNSMMLASCMRCLLLDSQCINVRVAGSSLHLRGGMYVRLLCLACSLAEGAWHYSPPSEISPCQLSLPLFSLISPFFLFCFL